MALIHHELCFGCGRHNLFGLLAELERQPDGSVRGRCFIKQDHQGLRPGRAHDGIVVTALVEAMALACGEAVCLRSLELDLEGEVPVGTFLEVSGQVHARSLDEIRATGIVGTDSDCVGAARGSFRACRRT